ncbi:Kelch domain-containing protein [Dirofilaria immitis]
MACWIVSLPGGPKRSNQAAVAIGDKIYSFGDCVCSDDQSTIPEETFGVHVLNTVDYRWNRVIAREFESDESQNLINESEQLFQPYGEIPTKRHGHTAVLYNGMVYMWGGFSSAITLCSKMYCFDPEKQTWSVIPCRSATPPARARHTAVVYDNMMFVYGGRDAIQLEIPDNVWAYNFDTQKWYEMIIDGESPPGREYHTACVVNEKMYIFGGIDFTNGELDVDVLNLERGYWERLETTGVYNDKIYVFGGCRFRDGQHTSDLFQFDPKISKWHKMSTFGLRGPSSRQRHCGVIVGDRAYVFAGLALLTSFDESLGFGCLLEMCDLHVLSFNWTLKELASLAVLREFIRTDFSNIPPDLEFHLRMMLISNDVL